VTKILPRNAFLTKTSLPENFCVFPKFRNVKIPLYKLIGSIAIFRIRRCIHWLSIAICS